MLAKTANKAASLWAHLLDSAPHCAYIQVVVHQNPKKLPIFLGWLVSNYQPNILSIQLNDVLIIILINACQEKIISQAKNCLNVFRNKVNKVRATLHRKTISTT